MWLIALLSEMMSWRKSRRLRCKLSTFEMHTRELQNCTRESSIHKIWVAQIIHVAETHWSDLIMRSLTFYSCSFSLLQFIYSQFPFPEKKRRSCHYRAARIISRARAHHYVCNLCVRWHCSVPHFDSPAHSRKHVASSGWLLARFVKIIVLFVLTASIANCAKNKFN